MIHLKIKKEIDLKSDEKNENNLDPTYDIGMEMSGGNGVGGEK